MRLPVSYQWNTVETDAVHEIGTSRDVSAAGVYVEADKVPPLHVTVSLELILAKAGIRKSGVRLKGQGAVVRIEKNGFAVSLVRAQVLRSQD